MYIPAAPAAAYSGRAVAVIRVIQSPLGWGALFTSRVKISEPIAAYTVASVVSENEVERRRCPGPTGTDSRQLPSSRTASDTRTSCAMSSSARWTDIRGNSRNAPWASRYSPASRTTTPISIRSSGQPPPKFANGSRSIIRTRLTNRSFASFCRSDRTLPGFRSPAGETRLPPRFIRRRC